MIRHPVAFIVGPTGVGKSAIALRAAITHGASILSCDSVQCYRGLDVGSAKPSLPEQKQVPHFMIDIVDVDDKLTAAEYRRRGLKILDIETKSRPVMLVGGSGFYLRALEKGVFPIRQIPIEIRAKWRGQLASHGADFVHLELKKRDPKYAEKIPVADTYRVLRALEVIESEGRTWTEIQKQFDAESTPWLYRTLKIGLELPRSELREQIRERALGMVANGLREEVAGLIERGFRDCASLRSVGYKEAILAIEESWDDARLVEAITLSTMKLAKKQMTWFRGDPEVQWISAREPERVFSLLARWFEG